MSSNLLKQQVASMSRPPILIIDDEESITETLSDVLKDEGCEVYSALNGDDGIKIVKDKQPYLVFLDMWMPHKDGLETLRDLVKINPCIKVVIISGHATITNALEAMKAGAFDFLEKPFALKSITNIVDRAFQSYIQNSDVSVSIINQSQTSEARDSSEMHASLMSSGHPSFLTDFEKGDNLGQRTLKNSIVLYGQCLHSGIKSGLVLEPLPLNSGIHFAHLGSEYTVPAFCRNVKSTSLATTLMSDHVSASTIEHLMAALSAYRISNLLVKCNGEVPIFDGSSKIFCDAIEETGILEQGGDWFEFVPKEKIVFRPANSKSEELIVLEPNSEYVYRYELNYPQPVGQQIYEFTYTTPQSFKNEISPARTFGFMKDIEGMQRMGLAAGGRLNNFILINDSGVVNTDLRFEDELVRHKILDMIGDLYLFGRPIKAKITAKMTGHADNVELLNQILDNYLEFIKLS